MILGVCLVGLHWGLLIKYRKLKLEIGTRSSELLEKFIEKHSVLKVLFEDFRDENLLHHGFLSILVARDTLVSLTITILVSYPLTQSVILSGFSVLMCGYLALKNPFVHRLERASQIFLESCLLIVNLSVLNLAILDDLSESAITERSRFGLAIININIILNIAGVLIMGLRISQEIYSAYREYCEKKKRRRVSEVINLSDLKENGPNEAENRPNRDELSVDNSVLPQNSSNMVISKRARFNSQKRSKATVNNSSLLEESTDSTKALNQ